MARTVTARTSYQADARYLSTLIEAVEKDETQSADWKKTVIERLQTVAVMFVQVVNPE